MDDSWLSPCPRSHFSSPISSSSTHDVYTNRNKRKAREDAASSSPKISCCCHFTVGDLLKELDSGKYGNVSKEMNDLFDRRMASLQPFYKTLSKSASSYPVDDGHDTTKQSNIGDDLDELDNGNKRRDAAHHIIIIDSDEEPEDQIVAQVHQDDLLTESPANVLKASIDGDPSVSDKSRKDNGFNVHMEDNMVEKTKEPSLVPETYIQEKDTYTSVKDDLAAENKEPSLFPETYIEKKGTYIGVEDDFTDEDDEQYENNGAELAGMFQEMTFALESCKDTSVNDSPHEHETDDEEDCDHSYILKDDIGYVCRICGIIQKKIDSIIEYQYAKKTSNRTYKYEKDSIRDEEVDDILPGKMRSSGHDLVATEFYAHPRHSKVMKPHQVAGFNFLARNLVNDNPGGCILAHAPGSGKTLMIISFIQSFMAKDPSARPLVVLPKGILPIWKKEFLSWQVDKVPLLDFYSVNATGRTQQLEVLKQWVNTRSILFLGYMQFTSIVCDDSSDENTSTCQKFLLKRTSLLIMDEGHTPRNEDTDQLASLERVETPRKVVLSGTLYQNHVKEVFNILNLVRPRFLKLESSKDSKRRILSIIETTKKGNLFKKRDHEFYEMVEESLLRDGNLDLKANIIQGLRDMTSKVLHYYKGDSLDELPGLVDFTLFLNLSPQQKREVVELKKSGGRFKMSSDGGSIYVHPGLKSLIKCTARKDRLDEIRIDKILKNLDINSGVKAKFYLNLLRLCESTGEKLLVFSQYLPPMKFLERLTMKLKGWSLGKEIFMITGDLENNVRELHMESFNNSSDSRVLFGSIKACSEGISLVGASRIIVLDVHVNPSVTRQAIGRAFRPGQVRKVYTYRLVAAESPEQEDHSTCFKKESIPKLWFEWNGVCRPEYFQLEKLDVTDCGDNFLETPSLHEDVLSLYKR
ncbi:protein CHROMATIN REMODELING 35 [Daucus carota subsp. sativus]|uniref:protein CHROMATIN REMODELING 35 n=1 Tax=Daucus carota subsp. sativus TaxID=79200 RepID=UPI0007EF69A1|nr:PREDICTED: protein CHROMATIN REMODELING 35-like [Daucus carota subsp. sativus]XP_017229348.1 PREDICTED: protein CHROMATIN REMODELING 35-like [Daucus carota subsp. sativus]